MLSAVGVRAGAAVAVPHDDEVARAVARHAREALEAGRVRVHLELAALRRARGCRSAGPGC